jgi:DNA-binding MarR family transcriptional regulator
MSKATEAPMEELLGSAQVFSAAVNGLLEAQIERAGLDVALSQVRMLSLIERLPNCGIGDVADYMGVSSAAVSRAVDRLVRRGLVSRTTAGEDRRAVDLVVTNEGRAILHRFQAAVRDSLGELTGSLEGDRVRQAIMLLDQLSLVMVQRYADVDESCFRCGLHFREKCVLRRVVGRHCMVVEGPDERAGATSGNLPPIEKGRE